MGRRLIALVPFIVALAACGEGSPASPKDAGAKDVENPFTTGTPLRVSVPDSGRVYVTLGDPKVVQPGADPKASLDWDLAFEGWEVFTNSGPSGAGKGAGFGPLDAFLFIGDTIPEHPFVSPDKPGGAFLGWYLYTGAPDHVLYSRSHVYGVKSGGKLFKVQVRSYYSERDGAPVSALFKVRFAELTSIGAGPTTELDAVDGTAGGASALPSVGSECVDLATGTKVALTPADARVSTAWDLCFRRDAITVNGEIGGPRGDSAVDLDAASTPTETLDTVSTIKDLDAKARFAAITPSSFDGKTFRGDRVISIFDDAWYVGVDGPKRVPAYASWLVQDAGGTKRYLVAIGSFENPTTSSPGTVVMRIKPVK
ncbi:hypothetical protein BH09MYX1_BH09MYX1_11080 [soil metagenome]